jgi:hypothetical protein
MPVEHDRPSRDYLIRLALAEDRISVIRVKLDQIETRERELLARVSRNSFVVGMLGVLGGSLVAALFRFFLAS